MSAFTKKENFGDVHRRRPTEYFAVKSEQEMDLVSVIAMNFMKVFLIFLRLEQGSRPLESQNPSLVTPASIVPIRSTNCAGKQSVVLGVAKISFRGGLTIITTIFYQCRFGFGGASPPLAPLCSCGSGYKVRNLNVVRVMLKLTNIEFLGYKFEIL